MVCMDKFFVIPKGERYVRVFSQEGLSSLFQFTYLASLSIASPRLQDVVKEYGEPLQASLTPRQHWMGVLIGSLLQAQAPPPLIISWINSTLGYGVFAGEEMGEGTVIGAYFGEIVLSKAIRPNDYVFGYRTPQFSTPFHIDAGKQGGITRFINHSESPNLEVVPVLLDGLLHLFFLSLCPIEKGRQLTISYGSSYWKARGIVPSSSTFSLDPDQLHFEHKNTIGPNFIAKPYFSISQIAGNK